MAIGLPPRRPPALEAWTVSDAIAVILNAGSGPDRAGHGAAAVRAGFARHGLAAEVTELAPGGDLAAILDEVMASGAKCVVAGGGDGTINAVAARVAEDAEATLGVLPLGTLNHFAKDLGLPPALDDAIKVIADGHRITVDVAEVNGRIFLNNASVGLYATIVIDREQQQKRLGRSKWPALARATWHALRAVDAFDVVVCVDGQELRRRTPFIFVGNNDYIVQGPGIGERARLDDGALSVYVLRPKNAAGLLWLAVRALFGRVSWTRDLDAFSSTGLSVETPVARLDVARDGEVDPFDTPLHFKVRPRALRVFAPAPLPESPR
jgi:YegS/Rv2252/BmrU family lipid kinase